MQERLSSVGWFMVVVATIIITKMKALTTRNATSPQYHRWAALGLVVDIVVLGVLLIGSLFSGLVRRRYEHELDYP